MAGAMCCCAWWAPGVAWASTTSAYVANLNTNGAGGVSQYDIGAGGALSPMSTPTVAGGNGPNPIAISPDGKRVYVANENANGAGGVSQYEIGAGGELSPMLTPTVAAGNEPFSIAVSPDGKSVYVANFGTDGAGECLAVRRRRGRRAVADGNRDGRGGSRAGGDRGQSGR